MVVGQAWAPAPTWRPFVIDRAGSAKLISTAAGLPSVGFASGVSDAGLVVGYWGAGLTSFVWTAQRGTEDLTAYLTARGLPLAASAGIAGGALITPNGKTLVGGGYVPGYSGSVFLARLCYANCDDSPEPVLVSIADFLCFLQKFAGGDSYANCDASVTPPVLNIADFTCFLQKYAAGCP
jgi:hypothetical protein